MSSMQIRLFLLYIRRISSELQEAAKRSVFAYGGRWSGRGVQGVGH